MHRFLTTGAILLMMTSAALAQAHAMKDPELTGAQQAMDAGDTAQALTLFREAAAKGNSTAMEHVCVFRRNGTVVSLNRGQRFH